MYKCDKSNVDESQAVIHIQGKYPLDYPSESSHSHPYALRKNTQIEPL